MSQWTDEEIQRTLNDVGRRSAVDAEFRRLCLENPNEAIEAVSGIAVPAAFRVRFVENEGASLTVVLPDPVSAGGELSDAELEQVAGGKGAAASIKPVGVNLVGGMGLVGNSGAGLVGNSGGALVGNSGGALVGRR